MNRMKKWILYYLFIAGLAGHGILGGFGYYYADEIKDHWRWKAFSESFQLPAKRLPVTSINPGVSGSINPSYESLQANRWYKISQLAPDDAGYFERQYHAGSAYDSKRGRLILFGSDTHGTDWSNAIRTFDMAALKWDAFGGVSDPALYSVNQDGVPVAELGVTWPWAMHTFDAIDYDRSEDQLIVASYPEHLVPGRFGNWVKDVWGAIKVHPTWHYDFKTGQWSYNKKQPVSFFPYATAYDTKRKRLFGFRPDGVFEYSKDRGWTKIAQKGINVYHTNAVYDAKYDVFVIFGTHKLSNSVFIYRPGDRLIQTMPTTGTRPPGTQASPFAYHPGMGKSVALIDNPKGDEEGAQTWLYDVGNDAWERVEGADFPYRLGMNYNMQYDTVNNQLILIAHSKNEPVSVWVLRL